MNFLLLTLLIVSMAVTGVGFLLSTRASSSRTSTRNRAITYYGVRRPDTGVIAQQRTVRYAVEVREPFSVSSLLLSLSGRFFGEWIDGQIPWKTITAGLIFIFVLGLYTFNTILPHQPLWSFVTYYGNPTANALSLNQPPSPRLYGASKALVRLSQLDPNQYSSTQEYNDWAYSACSTTSMTEVMNAYGRHYRITDVLSVEARLGEITSSQGLLEDIGIARTAAQFGFKTDWGHNPSIDRVINIANSGTPVIVSFPPDRYPGGHLLVMTGGDGKNVYLADSSRINRQVMTHTQFLQLWEGFYAILTPN